MDEELSDMEEASMGESPVEAASGSGGMGEMEDSMGEGIGSDNDVGVEAPGSSMAMGSMGDESLDEDGVGDSMVEESAALPTPAKPPAAAPSPAPAPSPASASPSKKSARQSTSPSKPKRQSSRPALSLEPSVDISELQTDNAELRARVLGLEEELSKAKVTDQQIKEMAERLERAEKAREEQTEDDLYAEVRELEEKLFEKGEDLVSQAEANYKLAERIREMNEKMEEQRQSVGDLRAALIVGIAGEDAEPARYQNVKTLELLRIRCQHVDTGENKVSFATTLARTKNQERAGTPLSRAGTPAESRKSTLRRSESKTSVDKEASGVTQIVETEREIRQLKDRNRKLYDRIQAMEEDLEAANEEAEQNETLRGQVHNYAERFRFEKENRARMEDEVISANEKIEALSDHIEKLMNHLKHEAAAKAKAYETGRRAERELQLLRNRNAALAKRNTTRERVITELKEGARILEDQLRLMDERYVELRGKLDWTRAHSQKEVKRISTQAERLQMKWMAAQSLGVIPKHLMDSPKELKETTMG